MESNTVERVTEWDSEPFTGGHDGLRELADREFSGAATQGNAWLFMLNGRVIGCFDGDIEDFADTDGTAYEAPDPALPLLFAMQEQGGETRAEYYTEETPVSEVNRTLESGNFTGYVELSENVLSGDYYVAYYGGRSLPVAFVGNQRERLTADDAFERADGEVGIYQVNTVELAITDIPGGESEPTAGGADETEQSTGTDAVGGAETSSMPTEAKTVEDTAEAAEPDKAARATGAGAAEEERDPDPSARETESPSEPAGREPSERATKAADSSTPEPVEEAETTDRDGNRGARERPSDQRAERRSEPQTSESQTSEPGSAAEQRWRGAKTIPALDPSESVEMADEVPGGVDETVATSTSASTPPPQHGKNDAAVTELREERDRLQDRIEELEADATELRAENERLQGERNRFERERDDAQAQVAELETEVDELRETVDRLEAEVESAESELANVEKYIPDGDHDVSADRALEGTNLFVRYDRKGGATLENAHDGNATRDDVNDNLRLEHHTDFEDEGAVVEGEPFAEWLHGTMEYGFGRWLVQEFVHDILETRNQSSLGKLFDAIPDIDRIEFQGAVELPAADEEAIAETATFDVVLRDRMGNPLVVADLNDSREPATESMLGSLIENATPVAQARETLSSAFFVTTSYYNPDALETAEEATGGSFLSRDKNKSFVKLSRKGGYHLCLVETRDGEFHVSVPEL